MGQLFTEKERFLERCSSLKRLQVLTDGTKWSRKMTFRNRFFDGFRQNFIRNFKNMFDRKAFLRYSFKAISFADGNGGRKLCDRDYDLL